VVFFGRELQLGLRVVVKQYTALKKKQSLAEIEVFTELEKIRAQQAGTKLSLVITSSDQHIGFPVMLGFKFGAGYGEILMTHGGDTMDDLMNKIQNMQQRVDYAADMLR